MKAQSEPVKLVGATSRAYQSFTDDSGRTVPAGTAWQIEVKEAEGPTRRYKSTPEAGAKAAALAMGSTVTMLLEVKAVGAPRVVGVEPARGG